MKISVVIPAHNEEGNLPVLLDQIRSTLPNGFHEIIVVDDGSTDATLDVVKAASESDPRVKYIGLSRNFGHQTALRGGCGAPAATASSLWMPTCSIRRGCFRK